MHQITIGNSTLNYFVHGHNYVNDHCKKFAHQWCDFRHQSVKATLYKLWFSHH